MKVTRLWRVRFSGAVDDVVRRSLEAGGAQSQVPRGSRNEVLVAAPAPDVAIRKVREALAAHGSFVDFAAEVEDDAP